SPGWAFRAAPHLCWQMKPLKNRQHSVLWRAAAPMKQITAIDRLSDGSPVDVLPRPAADLVQAETILAIEAIVKPAISRDRLDRHAGFPFPGYRAA
ncbi:MAG: hypothetical protein ABSG76_06570, partial [Xanthobacteraceae bacterium]